MKRHLLLLSALALSACAGRGDARPLPSAAVFVAAVRIDEPPAAAAAPSVQLAQAEPPAAGPRSQGRRRAPTARVEEANRTATREPSRQGYLNAGQVYSWTEGALYRLYATPERVSDIALQPGETLISVAAGDTARWVIGDTTSGSGPARRTHILVKPSAAGLRTNLVITTDRRVYLVDLESHARSFMASMSWTYPHDELLAVSGSRGPGAADDPVAGIALDALDFGYVIDGDDPPWRPLRAFDDGRQVFIELPAGVGAAEAPPLFVLGAQGGAELVNYRLRGRYYVVDRLFAAAELRLGEGRQQVVRITRRERTRGRGRRP